MDPVRQLTQIINSIDKGPCVLDEEDLSFIIDSVDTVMTVVEMDDERHLKSVHSLFDPDNCKITSQTIKKLQPLKKGLFRILDDYGQIFDLKEISYTEYFETDKPSFEDVLSELDDGVAEYSKFSEKKPMIGVYKDSATRYRICRGSSKTAAKNLEAVREQVVAHVPENYKPHEEFTAFDYFEYQKQYFACFWIGDSLYFDIQHIVSILDMKRPQNKYSQFASCIEMTTWTENEFGGYTERELVSEKIMFQIVLSSSSKFSKGFKEDVSQILAELHKANALHFGKDHITYIGNSADPTSINNESVVGAYLPRRYTSFGDCMLIRTLIARGAATPVPQYFDEPVIYAFILDLPSKDDHIIIKFGFTDDIAGRFVSLRAEYKCNLYLVGLKYVRRKKTEEAFHTTLKQLFPHLVEKRTIDGRAKTELYKYNEVLMDEFYKIIEPADKLKLAEPAPADLTLEGIAAIEDVRLQTRGFIDYMRSRGTPSDISAQAFCDYINRELDIIINENQRAIADSQRIISDNEKEVKLAQISSNERIRLAEIAAGIHTNSVSDTSDVSEYETKEPSLPVTKTKSPAKKVVVAKPKPKPTKGSKSVSKRSGSKTNAKAKTNKKH